MRKIPTLYVRNPHDRKHVLDVVSFGCEWVLDGEGVATRKFDGTCTMLDIDGRWWARRMVDIFATPPLNYVEIMVDPLTGKSIGWEPIEQSGFAKWHADALAGSIDLAGPGTYELVGPKINGNPEQFFDHALIGHHRAERYAAPRDFTELAEWLLARPGMEGLVWHHEDGRMAKIKRKDFA